MTPHNTYLGGACFIQQRTIVFSKKRQRNDGVTEVMVSVTRKNRQMSIKVA